MAGPRHPPSPLQAALEKERSKLLYSPPPGAAASQLGELVVAKLAQHAQAVQQLRPPQAEEGAQVAQQPMLRGASTR